MAGRGGAGAWWGVVGAEHRGTFGEASRWHEGAGEMQRHNNGKGKKHVKETGISKGCTGSNAVNFHRPLLSPTIVT